MKDVNYAWSVSAINRDDMSAFDKWFENCHSKIDEGKILYVWGAGIRGTEFGIFLRRKGLNKFYFVDSNKEKWLGNIDGNIIVSPEEALNAVRDDQGFILISTENDAGIIERLKQEGLTEDRDYYTARNLEYEKYTVEFLRAKKMTYMVMGDCLFSSVSLKDTNMDNLSDMMKKELDENGCKVLYMHGMGIRSYYNILRMHCMNLYKPDAYAIMINFETLNGKQHILPRSQHNTLFHMLDNVVEIKDDEWEEYLTIVDKRSENMQIEFSHKSSNHTPEQEKELKDRNYLRLNYMYKLDKHTEGLEYFRKTVDFCNKNGIRVEPFVPPVNYELGLKFFGEKFDDVYNHNLDVLKEEVGSLGLDLLDMSHIFTPDYFCEKDTTDESVNEKGRAIIKDMLTERLRG